MTEFRRRSERTGPDLQGTGESIAVSAVLFGVVLLFFAGTMALDGSARAVPGSVLVPLVILGAYVLRSEVRSRRRGAAGITQALRRLDLNLLAWILLLPVLVEAGGLAAGGALFVSLWLWRRGGERPVFAIGAGLATALILWLLTATVLQGVPLGGRLVDAIAAPR